MFLTTFGTCNLYTPITYDMSIVGHATIIDYVHIVYYTYHEKY